MKENRIEYLDGLRGLAAISVVISHFVLAYGLEMQFRIINFSPLHFFYDGFAAVTFFFVLSGYVLTLSLDNKGEFILGSFYLKRIFRIMPAYIFSLFISLLFYLFYKVIHTNPDSTSWINSFWGKPLDFENFLKQIIFILPSKGFAELICQNWALKVEIEFYLLFPFMYLIYKHTNFCFFLIFNLILFYIFDLPVYLFHFSLGIILAMNQNYIITSFSKYKKKYNIIIIFIIIIMYTYRYTIPMYYYYFVREKSTLLSNDSLIWFITGFGSFLIIIQSLTSSILQRILSFNFFKFIGKISYAIYLTHLIVLIFIVPFYINILNAIGLKNSYFILLCSLLFLLLITFIFSYLVTQFIEVPAAKYGNNFIKRFSKYWNCLILIINKNDLHENRNC